MKKNYVYKKRRVPLDTQRQFRLGEGKISAFICLGLGILSVLSVLAYRYPEYLTTLELRQVYDAKALQLLLKYGMYFSLFFGALSLFLGFRDHKKRNIALAGVTLTLLAFLLGGYSLPIGPVEPRRLSLGVDWLILAFLGSVIVFTSLEKLFPKYKNQVILRHEWGVDLCYFCFNHLMISVMLIYANYHVSHFDWALSTTVQSAIQSIPIWLQVVIVIICADFVLYWEHRLYHEVNFLWPFHAVHHSVEHLDWLAGSRGHFVQVFLERAMVMVPLYLLGADKLALDIYVTFAALQAILIHANVRFSFGVLRYIFVTPQFHHWHHGSEDAALDTNYSAHTVLFDWLFKTYHLPSTFWPATYGTVSPIPKTVTGQLVYPFQRVFKVVFNRDKA